MKHLPWILLVYCMPLLAVAQSANLQLGNQEFKQLNYNKAIIAYEAASDKNLKAYRNLADCYLTIGRWENARNCLQRVCESDQPSATDFWKLSQILMRLQDYDAARLAMDRFCAKAPRDTRAKAYRNAGDYLRQLSTPDKNVEIRYPQFNSREQDFGLARYKGKLVFASTRHPFSLIVQEWNGNQSSFTNLYVVDPYGKHRKPKPFLKTFEGSLHDGPVAFSADGKLCAITRSQIGKKDESGIRNLGIYLSAFDGEDWGEPVPFPYNDSTYSIAEATLDSLGTVMYFVSDMPGGMGGTDIWRSECREGKWTKPKPVRSLNTEGDEKSPYVLEKLGIMLFATDGRVGLGGLDIFAAKQREDRFVKIRNLGTPINSSADEYGMIMDSKMRIGYLASNRPAPPGVRKKNRLQDTLQVVNDDDIYWVHFDTTFSFGKTIAGIAIDENGSPVDSAVLTLYRKDSLVKTIITSENGQYEFSIDSSGNYAILGKKTFYFDGETKLKVNDDIEDYTTQITLKRDPKISVRLITTDSELGDPMAGIHLTVVNLLTRDTTQYITPENGEFYMTMPQKSLRDSIAFQFVLQMEGYITKTITYRRQLDHFGNYDLHKARVQGRFLDFSMRKKTLGDDLALQLGLRPYFFENIKDATEPDTSGDMVVLVRALRDNPGLKIEVQTHTDCRGSAESNLALSERRAKAIVEYLQARIPDGKQRITGKGMGEVISKSGCACEGLYNSNCSPEEYQIDRRTEFIIKGI